MTTPTTQRWVCLYGGSVECITELRSAGRRSKGACSWSDSDASCRIGQMTPLNITFGLLFTAAATLSVASGILLVSSFFMADRGSRSAEFLGIHLFACGVFLALGLLLAGVAWQVVGIARTVTVSESGMANQLRRRVSRLLVLLVIAGLSLCGVLTIVTYAILSRIKEGFAVFG
jgi:hypothetical protein